MWDWPNDLSLLLFCSHSQLPLIYKSLNHPSFISQLEVPFSKEKEHQAKHSNLIHFTPTTLLLTQFHFSSLFLSQTIICRLFRRLLPTLSIWSTFFARVESRLAESLSNAPSRLSPPATGSARAEPIGRAPAPS